MNESAEAGQAPQLDETKHTRSIRLADGHVARITRGDLLHAVTIFKLDGAGVRHELLTLWVNGDDLRQLCTLPGPARCSNCKHSRVDKWGATRCHRGAPRVRGGETTWTRVTPDEVCAHHRPVVVEQPRAVAP